MEGQLSDVQEKLSIETASKDEVDNQMKNSALNKLEPIDTTSKQRIAYMEQEN